MNTLYTAALSALLCSLVWIGGTAKIINEYIKVIEYKDGQINELQDKTRRDSFTIMRYDNGLREFLIACTQKQELVIDKKTYICFPIEKA